jgi:putative endonuclease
MHNRPAVTIMASARNGTLYIGVMGALENRANIHKQDLLPGFTSKYAVHRLVYYEFHETMAAAIVREKQLKKWNRLWKLRIIEEMNPEWRELYDGLNNALHDGPADVARQREAGDEDRPGFPPSRE